MNKDEQLRFCLMLAFQTVITQGNNAKSDEGVQRIIGLARLINEFCDLHMPQAFPKSFFAPMDDKKAAKLNSDINLYGEELQKQGSTVLPDDRETLIELYDRIQHRKTQYSQLEFYAHASKQEISAAILTLLKEVNDLRFGGVR